MTHRTVMEAASGLRAIAWLSVANLRWFPPAKTTGASTPSQIRKFPAGKAGYSPV